MRKLLLTTSLTMLLMFKWVPELKAQDVKNGKNVISAYIGMIDLNLNYERNIGYRPKSASYLRLGFGHASIYVAGEGYYVGGAFVHLVGETNSHLELDFGLKYMVTNSIPDPVLSDQLIPDIFVGYRFEKPTGGVIFRFGVSYPTILNLGIGYKF